MKTIFTILVTLLISLSSFAQNQGINYKALIKDSNGNVLANQSISLKFIISIGIGEETIYEEEHTSVDTDSNGIIILNIGEGSIISGSFSNIDWDPFSSYVNLRIEIDLTGGTSYVFFGQAIQFKSVPYAKMADNIKNQAFSIQNNVIKPTDINDSFLVGSTQLDNDDITFGTTRLLFDKFRGAFRAGRTNNDVWDTANRGQNSFASGNNTKASGSSAVAMGNSTEAIGQTSSAFGDGTKATGLNATAMGSNTIASTSNSTAIGSYNFDDPSALFMVGNGNSEGTRTNALTIKTDGSSILNGSVVVSGDLDLTGRLLLSGEVQHPNTEFANVIPIAYGSVNANGTVAGGTGNFTASVLNNVYTINVVSKTLLRGNTSVSVIANTSTFRNANATFNNGNLEVHLFTSTFTKVPSDFQFTIYQE
tara:strand:+ start:182 stop:1447 length:1266 start_codon:yes stop_codon:yes gene_type:complete